MVSPFTALKRLIELAQTSDFYISIALSVSRILLGFLIALITATISAVLSHRFKIIEHLLAPLVFTIRSTPVTSIIILILIWVPSRRLSIVITFLMAFPIIYENIQTGIESVDKNLLEVAQVFQFSKADTLKSIYLSEVLPYFQSACITALGLSWKAGIAAEVIGLPKQSIGRHIYDAKVYLETPDLFAWTITIIILSILFQKVLTKLIQYLIHHIQKEL